METSPGPVPPPTGDDVTALLARLRAGDRSAFDALFPLLYDDLRARAHRQLARGRPGETLSTTALVHEAFLKLAGADGAAYNDRVHFLAVAARAMRQIVIDEARRRLAAKRGGGAGPATLESDRLAAPAAAGLAERAEALVALDAALADLARLDERLARTVELRFFGELSVEETAAALGVSPRTVKRDWQKARAILHAALGGDGGAVAPAPPPSRSPE